MTTRGYPTYIPPGKPMYAGDPAHVPPPQTSGFVTPAMVPREHVSVWAVWWNEFWGSLFYAFVARLFIAVSGGSAVAGTIPILFGNAFTQGFAYFVALAIFGAVSGGHFNPAITLAVWIIEIVTDLFFGWNKQRIFQPNEPWKREEGDPLYPRQAGDVRQPRELRWWVVWIPMLYPLLQFIAFLIAALLIWAIMPGTPRSSPIDLGIPYVTSFTSDSRTFGAEILGSFLMIGGFVLLMKLFGTSSWHIQAMRALVFGFWYFVLVLSFAPYAGAVWNPGLWFAFAIVSGRFKEWWIFLFPPLISALLVPLFSWIHWWMSQIPQITLLKGSKRFEMTLGQYPRRQASFLPS